MQCYQAVIVSQHTPFSLPRYQLTHAEYVSKLPTGKHSTMGIGRTEPDPRGQRTTESGVVIPMGKGIPSTVTHTSLLYNEYPPNYDMLTRGICTCIQAVNAIIWDCSCFILDFCTRYIVYDVSQISIKYLLKMNFKFKW